MTILADKFNEGAKKYQKQEKKKIEKQNKMIEENIREELKKSGLNKSQMDFCMSESKHIRLLAPAGSGKTQSLLWRCKTINERMKQSGTASGTDFLVVTFTRVARDELRERLASEDDFSTIRDSVRITTLNEWGYQYLRSIESGLEVISKDVDRYNIMKHDLRRIFRASTKKIQGFYNATQRKRERYIDMIEIFDVMKNCGFRHEGTQKELFNNFEIRRAWLKDNGLERYFTKEITEKLKKLKILEDSDVSIDGFRPFLKVWKDTCDHLWGTGKITLDDQKYRSWIEFEKRYAKDHSLLPAPNRYKHILVDEFQDISPLDMFLVKTLSDIHESSLTIVGDDDQAIFEWRGSTPNFILKPQDYFKKEFETHILKINYRSPRNIIDHSQKLIANNKENRVPKDVVADNKEDAKVCVKKLSTHNECLDYILDFAREANKTGKPNQLGIIGRKKGQLIPMQIVLISEDIPFFARQDLNVAFSKAFKDLKEILEIVSTDHLGPTTNVANSFLKLLDYVKLYPIRDKKIRGKLFHYLCDRGVSDIGNCLKSIQHFDDFTDDKELFREAISGILPNGRGVSEVINAMGENLKGLQKHYPKSEDDIFYREPPFLYLAEYASRYGKCFSEFIKHLGKSIGNMEKRVEPESVDKDINNPVHIMTAFGAKGREFETTILLDVNDGVFPTKFAETADEKEAERRIFYVAVTRAKKRMILMTVETMLGRHVGPSPYIEEMGLKVPE